MNRKTFFLVALVALGAFTLGALSCYLATRAKTAEEKELEALTAKSREVAAQIWAPPKAGEPTAQDAAGLLPWRRCIERSDYTDAQLERCDKDHLPEDLTLGQHELLDIAFEGIEDFKEGRGYASAN